jgi:hypothetical protein
MRLVPLRRFRDKEYPTPGQQVEFDGRPAVVRAVGAGRVQVDYNHPLAGRTLVYDVSIDKVLENENEKILNLIALRIPEVAKEKFGLKKHQSDLIIEVPEEAFYLSGLQVAKKAVTSDLQKFFPDIDSVAFQEVFKRSEARPEELATTVKPAEASLEKKEEEAEAVPVSASKKPKSSTKKKETSPRKPSTSTSRKRAKMGSENQR